MSQSKYFCSRTQSKRVSGFSAIELLVVVAILGILATLAGPSFVASIERYRVNAIQQELVGSIQLARAEAIRRGMNVILIRTTGCAATLTGSDDWSCGWELVVDANGNDAKNTGELVLQTTSIQNGYGLMHPLQGSALRINIWGQAQGVGQKFVITPPTGVGSSATTTICTSSGGRIRKLVGDATCS